MVVTAVATTTAATGATASRQRREQQRAFVLHSYPYRETSLLVETFTAETGRVALLARGARRPRSEMRGVLQAFQPLQLSWSGAGDVKTLFKAEWQGGFAPPPRATLMSAFYLNELLLRFLPREDPHPALFESYETALRALAHAEAPDATGQAALLRRFELTLLTELGYAMPLTHETGEYKGRPVTAERHYDYFFEEGPRICEEILDEDRSGVPRVRGATLMALASGEYPDSDTAGQARRLMAQVLAHFLENRRLLSREVARELLTFRARHKTLISFVETGEIR